MSKRTIIKGTLILTITGILTKCLGFYNRIFLTRLIGVKELGTYQLIFPLYILGPRRPAGAAQRLPARRTHPEPDSDRRGPQGPQRRRPAPARRAAAPRPHGLPRLRRRRRRTLYRLELLLRGMGSQGTLSRNPRPPRKRRRSAQGLRRRRGPAGPHPRRTAAHAAGRRGDLPGARGGRRHLDHGPERPRTASGDAPQPDARGGEPLAGGLHRAAQRLDRLFRRHRRHRTQGTLRKIPRRGRRLRCHHGQTAGRPADRSLRRSRAHVRAAADVGLRNGRAAHAAADRPRPVPRPPHGLRLSRVARPFAQARGLRLAVGRNDDGHEAHRELHDRSRRSALRTDVRRRRLLLRRHDRHQAAARLRPAARHGGRRDQETDTQ